MGSGGEQGRVAGDDYARRRKDYQFERRVCYLSSLYNHLLSFSRSRLLINDDIDAIIQRGEERTIELNSKYEGLNLEDLSNFKSEASVQQWEGEDFRPGVSLSCLKDSCYLLPFSGKL